MIMTAVEMTEKNLGTLHDEILLFGGNYSNLQATQALQEQARLRGISPERVICTGDIVAYCAEPEATTRVMRDWGVPVVMGNCEESLGFDLDDCGCGFAAGTACAVLSDSWFRYSRSRVSDDNKVWMRGLPRSITFELGGHRFKVVHGGVNSINRFLFASLPDTVFAEEMTGVTADVVIGGHAGLPFARRCAQQYWLNAGVIGMPANDASRNTWFMLLKEVAGHVEVSWERLTYDAETASTAMKNAGLNKGYTQALLTGLWPSLDVLPEIEKLHTGKTLNLPPLTLR